MTLSTQTTTATTNPTHAGDPARPAPPPGPDVPHAVYVYEVDEVTYEFDHATITGAQIMAAAGVPEAEGIIQIRADGTRDSIAPTTVIELVSGAHFKRRPRFKRG